MVDGVFASTCSATYARVRDAKGEAARSPAEVRRTEAKRSPKQPDPHAGGETCSHPGSAAARLRPCFRAGHAQPSATRTKRRAGTRERRRVSRGCWDRCHPGLESTVELAAVFSDPHEKQGGYRTEQPADRKGSAWPEELNGREILTMRNAQGANDRNCETPKQMPKNEHDHSGRGAGGVFISRRMQWLYAFQRLSFPRSSGKT
jgi:hypothetical protein